jgi:hypothetical protein
MRASIMAGWFYAAMRMVRGEGESHTKLNANRDAARDLDCAELNLQTLAPACCSSQNVVKMPVDIGVLISLRLQSAQRMLAFSLLLMFAFPFSPNVEALEIKKEAVLLYGGVGKSFLTAQEAFDDVKAWLESQKAESIAIQGHYYQYVRQVPCNGKFFPEPLTINGVRADLLCNEWVNLYADGTVRAPPAIYDFIETSPVCPEPASMWGYPQWKDLGNRS